MVFEQVALVLAGALLGGFVSGFAGFGTGLAAMGLWLHAVPPATAATLVILCSVVAQIQTLPAIWHAMRPARVLPFVLPGLVGVPIGTALLGMVAPAVFKLTVGALLLVFSISMLVTERRPATDWRGRTADVLVGFGGGLLGGLAGLSGPLPTAWASIRGWIKDERRAVFQAFNLTILTAALVVHSAAGLITSDAITLTLVALPGTLSGAWLGQQAYRRVSDRGFQKLVLYLLAASGGALVWTSL